MDRNILPPLDKFNHALDLQIRFNDVDVLGHLNNTVYFSFYDTGKALFFESVLDEPMEWKRVECVIANIDCAYISPIYFGEQIQVLTRCKYIGEKSFTLEQVIIEKSTLEIKSCADTVMVSINPTTKQSKEIPPAYRRAMEKAMKAVE